MDRRALLKFAFGGNLANPSRGNVMKLPRRQFLHLAACAAALLATSRLATAQTDPTRVYIPDIVELSGFGAVFGTAWRDGNILAIEEVNAKGGILGRKIETPHLDTQSDASISRAQIQKVLDNDPYVILGPVFSGSVLVDMMLTQQAEVPHIVGGSAAAITQKNNPYVFRTSFGQQYGMPKIANYIRDGLKAKTVAVLSTTTSARADTTHSLAKRKPAPSGWWPTSRPKPGKSIFPPTSSS
jgi:branched-chain amino acid transport system substrate-binding protein